MIKSITAVTREIDDVDAAVNEILTKLNMKENLLKNSMGIISCFSEFAETGVLKAICDAMPFDCIGATTPLCSAEGETDQIMLKIIVLTSDDCDFETIALPITEDYKNSISIAINELRKSREDKPELILSYFPLMSTVSGDMILDAIDHAGESIPLFGTMAVDHLPSYPTAMTIHNGEAFRESVVLGFIFGDVDYSFEIASLNEEKIGKREAVITEADGNILISVNNKSVLDWLSEVGITKDSFESSLGILPFFIDYVKGAKPVARAVFAITPEGHVVCGGMMPVGATIAVGRITMDDVLESTENAVKRLDSEDGVFLSYSCLARYFALGANHEAEANKVVETAEGKRYSFAISGGEICPLTDTDANQKNLFHNYTNVFCRIR